MNNFFVKLILWILLIALLLAAAYGSFFIWKINTTSNKINSLEQSQTTFFGTFKNLTEHSQINLAGMEKDRINILLLGLAGEGRTGTNITDTVMIISINTKTNQVSMLSIPRDLYVIIPNTETETKINTLYQIGLNAYSNDASKSIGLIKEAIENITALDINYWVVVNFNGFKKAIDAIGGINVANERDIYDPRYPGPNFSYETFELKKGFQHLDGATALKYARMRHNDPEGDFGRAKRQQQVLQAAKNKIFSTGTLLNVLALNDLFNALGENIKTNIETEELGGFIELIKKIDTNNINNAVVDAWNKDSLLKVSHVFYGDLRSFILVPRIGNWSEVQDLAQNIFDTNIIKRRREEISKENATVAIINNSGNNLAAEKIKKLLQENFDYKNVMALSNPIKNIQDDSFIYDLTGGAKPFTLDELILKLPAKPAPDLDENYKNIVAGTSPDLLVVIGKNLVKKYTMEEDSFEEYNKSADTNEYQEFLKN